MKKITRDYFRNLSLRQIKQKVEKIKAQLPEQERNIITYSRNFTLSLSNYCVNQCGYCFYNFKIPKISGEGNVVLLDNEKITKIVQKALHFNCKEALIISGENPDSFTEVQKELEERSCPDYIEFIKDICQYLLDFKILPHLNIGNLSYDQLNALKPFAASMGIMLESTSEILFKKGGTHELSPTKKPEIRIEHIINAGKLKIPFTTGLLLGIGETFDDRIRDLFIIKEIHEKYGHIQEVILQNFIHKEGIPYKPDHPLNMEEFLKTTGIAKIIFGNEISVQVPPNLIKGHEKDFIHVGIDDFGGISPFTLDYINPNNEWPQIEHLEKMCNQQGFELKERLPIYKKYINKSEFFSDNIKKVINIIN